MINRKLLAVLTALAANFTSITVQAQVSPQSHNHGHVPTQAAKPVASGSKMKMPAMMGIGDRTQMERDSVMMMIRQDEMLLALADLTISRAEHPELKEWADSTKAAKTQEISQLKDWSKQWYGVEVNIMPQAVKTTGKMMEGMGKKNTMVENCMNSAKGQPMMMETMVQESLTALKTTATFDQDLTQQVIRQNKMAVMMASMMLDSDHPELRTLAQATIKDQAAEAMQFQIWYQVWFP